jgi:hypothetical protein
MIDVLALLDLWGKMGLRRLFSAKINVKPLLGKSFKNDDFKRLLLFMQQFSDRLQPKA